jgi:hypothetical protein
MKMNVLSVRKRNKVRSLFIALFFQLSCKINDVHGYREIRTEVETPMMTPDVQDFPGIFRSIFLGIFSIFVLPLLISFSFRVTQITRYVEHQMLAFSETTNPFLICPTNPYSP